MDIYECLLFTMKSLHIIILSYLDICVNYFFKRLFIWERECTGVGGRAEGENLKQIPCWVRSPMQVLDLMTHEIITEAETKSWTLNWLSYPGAPKIFFMLCIYSFSRYWLGFTSTPGTHFSYGEYEIKQTQTLVLMEPTFQLKLWLRRSK